MVGKASRLLNRFVQRHCSHQIEECQLADRPDTSAKHQHQIQQNGLASTLGLLKVEVSPGNLLAAAAALAEPPEAAAAAAAACMTHISSSGAVHDM